MTQAAAPTGFAPMLPVIAALLRRSLISLRRTPSNLVPTLAMPVFFVVVFSGAYAGLAQTGAFSTSNVTDWFAPFSLLQGAGFAGIGASVQVARDLETGFYDRLLLAPVRRASLVIGAVLYSMVRATVPLVLVFCVALVLGARMRGGIVGFAVLAIAAWGLAGVMTMFGLGLAYRTRSQRSMAVIQICIFAVMFLSIGQAPIGFLTGWLKTVARYNPFTNVLRMARQGFLGDVTWADTWPGLLALVLSAAVLSVWVTASFRTVSEE